MAAGLNLREQLRRILPEILPKNPAEAIKGTELIQLVKFQLHQNYSDATLRYHFSIMSCDPSSPIAKVEQGQGYYLRSTTLHSLASARNFIPMATDASLFGDDVTPEEVDIVLARANKFRAIFKRSSEFDQKFPFAFERSFAANAPSENHWRFPDVITVRWLVGEPDEDGGLGLKSQDIEIRRRMGGAPFQVCAVKLKLDTHYATMREDLFKTLSAGLWANTCELVIAAELPDEQLVEDIRKLADQFGVGVTSLGMTADVIDDLPEQAAIENLTLREFEALERLFNVRRISLPKDTGRLDWDTVNHYRGDDEDFAMFYDWVSRCLVDERAYTVDEFLDFLKEELEPIEDAA